MAQNQDHQQRIRTLSRASGLSAGGPPDSLDRGLVGCDARLMVASLKGPQPILFWARTLYWYVWAIWRFSISSILFLGLSIITFFTAPTGPAGREEVSGQRRFEPPAGWTVQLLLTLIVVDGGVEDLIGCDDTVGLCRLRPADLSDGGTDDCEGQATRFSRD